MGTQLRVCVGVDSFTEQGLLVMPINLGSWRSPTVVFVCLFLPYWHIWKVLPFDWGGTKESGNLRNGFTSKVTLSKLHGLLEFHVSQLPNGITFSNCFEVREPSCVLSWVPFSSNIHWTCLNSHLPWEAFSDFSSRIRPSLCHSSNAIYHVAVHTCSETGLLIRVRATQGQSLCCSSLYPLYSACYRHLIDAW